VPLRGNGTCRRSLCACAPPRSNTAIIAWKHPVPPFARRYYIYHTVTLPCGGRTGARPPAAFHLRKRIFPRAKNLTYNNTLQYHHYYYYYYYSVFRYRSTTVYKYT